MAFDNRDGFAGTRKSRRERRAGLARPDDDCVEVPRCGSQRAPSMWILAFLTASSEVSPP
jgi:hypothetical protein